MTLRVSAVLVLLGAILLGEAPGRVEAQKTSPAVGVPLAAVRTPAVAAGGKTEDARFARLIDDYLAEFTATYPTQATQLGIHDHDQDLEDVTPAGLLREEAWLGAWEQRLSEVREGQLARGAALDLKALRHAIGAARFGLREAQDLRRLPDRYVRLCSGAVYGLIKRDFAPAAQRLQAVIAREEKLPALLKAAEENLTQMAPISVDVALDDLRGTVGFFQRDVPAAFLGVKDEVQKGRLARSTAGVVQALAGFEAFLRGPGRARATGKVALGEALFVRRLHWDEMIDVPLGELRRRGEVELARLQEEFRRTAAKIDPQRTPEEVHAAMWQDHPAPAGVIPETQARLAVQRRFLIDHDLVGIPSDVLPRVQETPPFLRATSLASMDTPGPFERAATEAYYNVTLPDPSWPPARTEDFLRGAYNRPLIDVVTIHEAFPGHYIQFLWLSRVSSTRKFTGVGSNEEGWAHYTEQMMLDEGFGGGDPRLRLAQLQDALLRAARYVVAIRMHTGGMTYEQAVEFFQKEGRQTQQVALVEARRGTQDPLYLRYTYGKLEFLRLREAYRKRLGAAFTLRKFHDAVLAEGNLGLPLLWQALLGAPQG